MKFELTCVIQFIAPNIEKACMRNSNIRNDRARLSWRLKGITGQANYRIEEKRKMKHRVVRGQ